MTVHLFDIHTALKKIVQKTTRLQEKTKKKLQHNIVFHVWKAYAEEEEEGQ